MRSAVSLNGRGKDDPATSYSGSLRIDLRSAQANTANFNALTAGTSYTAPAVFSNGGLDFDVLFSLAT